MYTITLAAEEVATTLTALKMSKTTIPDWATETHRQIDEAISAIESQVFSKEMLDTMHRAE
jgi:hypothetical protein